jgi:hypothetical protein
MPRNHTAEAQAAEAIREAYPRFRDRTEPMKLREAIEILRSPDVRSGDGDAGRRPALTARALIRAAARVGS